MKLRAVLYDWDGTLLDDMCQEYKGCEAVFRVAGLKPPGLHYFCQKLTMPFYDWFVGHGVNVPKEQLLRIYYAVVDRSSSKLFPGAKECLRTLHRAGLKLGIVSARKWSELHHELEKNELVEFLETTVGEVEEKAEAIMQACDEMKISPRQAMYVGDLSTDVLAGKRAGVMTVGFLGSFGAPASFIEAQPDYLAVSHEDLRQIVFSILGHGSDVPLPPSA